MFLQCKTRGDGHSSSQQRLTDDVSILAFKSLKFLFKTFLVRIQHICFLVAIHLMLIIYVCTFSKQAFCSSRVIRFYKSKFPAVEKKWNVCTRRSSWVLRVHEFSGPFSLGALGRGGLPSMCYRITTLLALKT